MDFFVRGGFVTAESRWLVVCGAKLPDGAWEIRAGKYLIGRTKRCDIRLEHALVSRRHAMLVFEQGVLTISDLGSSNGTCVNGCRIVRATESTPRCTLRLGRVTLELTDRRPVRRAIADEDEATPPPRGADGDEQNLRHVNLPPRRKRVLRLLLHGLATKQIASRLKLSRHTVRWHEKEMHEAFHVHTRAELVAQFRQSGL